jgi:hypothetical protein
VSSPLDLHSAAVFDTHMPCRVHAAPLPCHDHAVLKAASQGHGTLRHGHAMGTAWEWNGMCELASAIQRRHVGDLPAFSFFRLPRGVPRRLLSEAYQSVKLYRSNLNREHQLHSGNITCGGHRKRWCLPARQNGGQSRLFSWFIHTFTLPFVSKLFAIN